MPVVVCDKRPAAMAASIQTTSWRAGLKSLSLTQGIRMAVLAGQDISTAIYVYINLPTYNVKPAMEPMAL